MMSAIRHKPDIDKFVNQVGAGQSIVRIMEQCSANLRTNSAKVNAELDVLSQELGSLTSSSIAFGKALEKDYSP
jgi:hypothetical protein